MFMGLTLARNLAHTSGFPVFSVDYHLAPFGRFPVPLIQCVSAYVHLTRDLGFRGDQIIVAGDSNGSHLALQIERFLRLEGAKIPSHQAQRQRGEPDFAAMLLLSPWLVATNDMMPERETNLKYDIVPRTYGDWGVREMQFGPSRRTGMQLDDPWISPLLRPVEEVAQMPPTYIANGQLEVLVEEGKRFAAKCKQAGLITRYHVTVSKFTLVAAKAQAHLVQMPDMPEKTAAGAPRLFLPGCQSAQRQKGVQGLCDVGEARCTGQGRLQGVIHCLEERCYALSALIV